MAERWNVKSGDGGSIAVWVEGEGPPLVLVHGSVSDHNVFAPLVGELRDEFTLFAMDRRGFGASRDGSGYSRNASSATLRRSSMQLRRGLGSRWCYSALPGARTAHSVLPEICRSLRALILYELSLGLRHAPGSIDRIEERVAAGDSESVLIEMEPKPAHRRSDRGTAGGTKLVPARRQRPHGRPRGSHRRGLELALPTLRRHRRPHPAPHRIRNPARARRDHIPDRLSNPMRACPRPRRPRPLRPCV